MNSRPYRCEFCCERVLPTRCVKTQGDLFIEPANRDGKEVSPGMPSRNSRKGRKKKAAEIPRGSHDARSCNPRTCTSTTAPSEAQTEIGCKLTKAGYGFVNLLDTVRQVWCFARDFWEKLHALIKSFGFW